MSEPVSYEQAAALAKRLARAREYGVVLLLDGRRVISSFECGQWITFRVLDFSAEPCQFWSRTETRTFAEFDAFWRERITLLWPGAWPTGEAVTWEQVQDAAWDTRDRCESICGPSRASVEALAKSAERLSAVCRELALHEREALELFSSEAEVSNGSR